MSDQIHAVLWLSLSILAMMGLFMALLVLSLYWSQLRTLDVFLTSLTVALLLNICVLVCMPAVMELASLYWSEGICNIYIWACVALRCAEVLTATALSLDRVLFLHSGGKYTYAGSCGVKYIVVLVWVTALFAGVIPVVGWDGVDFHYPDTDTCGYAAHEISKSYCVTIIVVEFSALFVCCCCLLDVFCHMRYYTRNTIFTASPRSKDSVIDDDRNDVSHQNRIGYSKTEARATTQTGTKRSIQQGSDVRDRNDVTSRRRNYPDDVITIQPNVTAGNHVYASDNQNSVRSHGGLSTVKGSLNIASAFDNCRLVCIIVGLVFLVNHLPYTVSALR